MKRNQSGFTMIEISITMAVISVLISATIKGQEIINNARVKDLSKDFKNIPLLIYGYQDKFRALPGDDVAAVTHVSASAAGNGNGVINGNWDSTSIADESFMFWQHVRLAGLAPGSTAVDAPDYLPVNVFGNAVGIQSASNCTALGVPSADCTGSKMALVKGAGGKAIRGSYLFCSSGILGKYVKQLDVAMDDGNTDAGAMMAIPMNYDHAASPIAATAANAIDDAALYDVCMGV